MIFAQAKAMDYAPTFFGVDGMDGILTMPGFDVSLAEGLVLMTPFSATVESNMPPSYRLRQRSCCAGQAVQFFRLRRLRIKNSAACGLRKEGYALQTIQAAVVPFLLAFTAMYAVYRGTAVFPVFIEGAKKGMQTAVGILPTMIGMLTAVYMLRASGAIDLASAWLAPLFHLLGIPQSTSHSI